jgi:NTP pyrophosphatase (non-canonical NTP hydrolase)
MNDKDYEALLITQEECAEVTQAISKCFRFGLDQIKPGKPKTNREHLEEEIGDLLCMVDILIERKVISSDIVEQARLMKKSKLIEWSGLYKE